MPLNRISPKRKATTTLGHNSTFAVSKVKKEKRVYSIAEMKASGLLKRASKLGDSKSERAKWKAKADKWFSEFIRLRDSDEHGIATCVTSGRRMRWQDGDCGHWISRAKEGTRYHEFNAHFQSKQANRFQGGHFLEHGLAIERIHGEGTRAKLERIAGTPCKRTTQDYRFLAETYKARVDRIREMEPGKF